MSIIIPPYSKLLFEMPVLSKSVQVQVTPQRHKHPYRMAYAYYAF